MAWGSIISSAAGVAGALIGKKGQEETNAANARQAALNRNFQERMSNTAVQRRMADMRQGGINPLLAGKYDASTPAGAMATFGNPGAAATAGFSQVGGTANTLATGQAQRDKMSVEEELTRNKEKITSIMADVSQSLRDHDWSSMAARFREDFSTFGAVVIEALNTGLLQLDDTVSSLKETQNSMIGTAKGVRDNLIMRLLDIIDTRWDEKQFNDMYNNQDY